MKGPQGTFPGWQMTDRTRYVATGEYRAPKKGEYFLSGAKIEAYRCASDGITMEYWIAKPVEMKPCPTCSGSGCIAGESEAPLSIERKCPDCQGKGCQRCQQSGRIRTRVTVPTKH